MTSQEEERENAHLDALLAEEPALLAPSDALLQRLRAIPEREPQTGVVVQFPPRARVWASVAAAAALLLGVLTGVQGNQEMLGEQSDDGASAELSEFGALALGSELVADLGQIEGVAE